MKPKFNKYLSIALAGMLQILPLVRSVLPNFLNAVRTPMGAIIARWAAGGAVYFGYHAISGATTLNYAISISPAQAVQGQSYNGTLTWTGGFSGSTRAMTINGVCLGSYSPSPGLSITYNPGTATATISGIPTATNLFTLNCWIYEYTGCGGLNANRTSPQFSIISSNDAPHIYFNIPPANTAAIVGNPVNLFGSASALPTASYQWQKNLVTIPGATNDTYSINFASLTNAGTYSLVASNSQGHPSDNCVLSIIVPPGTNFTTLNWTNYWPAGVALTMTSLITNTPSATNTYSWAWNNGASFSSNQNVSFTAAQVTPAKSGTYTVYFGSTFGTNVYANGVEADTQWQFGYAPAITTQPTPVTVGSGSNATFTCTMSGGNFPNVFLYQNGTNLVAQTNFPSYNPNTSSSTTNLSLTIPNVTPANAGNYTFVLTNFWGSVTSSAVALTVTQSLAVSSPVGQTNYAGKSVSLSVTASGNPPFSFQWQKGPINLTNGGNISGVTTSNLTFYPAATTNNGSYRVVVTNNSGSIISSSATVSIIPVPKVGVTLGANNATLSASGGIVGSNYVVQVTTNLGGSNWTSLLTNAVPSGGNITFTDTNSPNRGQKYYRLQFP